MYSWTASLYRQLAKKTVKDVSMSSSNGDTLNFNVNLKVKGKNKRKKEREDEEKESREERQGRKQTALKKIKNMFISYYLSMGLSAEEKSTWPVWW